MRKKNNPNPWSQPDPSTTSTARVGHYLFDYSFPEGLIESSAIVSSSLKPVAVALPHFPDTLFATLPEFLKKMVDRCSLKEERDLLLLGALVTLSACFPKMHGCYAGFKVHPNLFLFVAAQSSENKDYLSLCKRLVLPVHDFLTGQNQLMRQQLKMEGKQYKKFPEKGLLIPANSSRPGVFKRLADNDGQGLIIESDGEVIAKAIKIKLPHFIVGLKKGFHHETISYFALAREGCVEIKDPCMTVLLSGNFKLLSTLIPYAADGLFSRFIFYFRNNGQEWNDVLPLGSDASLETHFDQLGKEFLSYYERLNQLADMEFNYTKEQQNQFNYFFSLLHDGYGTQPGIGFVATIRRLGLIAFRISMVLSALRHLESGTLSPQIVCQEVDFQASLSIVRVLVKHAGFAYSKLPYEENYARRRR